jgi:hypothetical protein
MAALGAFVATQSAKAVDSFHKGPDGGNWNVAGDWQAIYQGGVISTVVPQGSSGFNMRAVIGTDNPTYGLAKSVVLNAPLPATKATIHGLALGSREQTPQTPLSYVNPAPAAGTMVGTLTISGATTVLNNTTGPHAAIGADGSIKVGVEGRGYLTMLGGTLSGTSLSVAGEDISTGNGTSLLDLRGSSILTITGLGTSTFSRRVRIEGPSVNFTSGGNLTLQATNTLTAVITSSTLHSPLKTNANAFIGGALNVEFSGAGATHSVGETWDLVDAVGSIPGAAGSLFNNLGPGGIVTPTGLAGPSPLGTAYRVKKVVNPMNNHTLLQLAYEGLLVLQVNRDTGELKITNPHGASIAIESYDINSPLGSLLSTYKGISGAPAGDTGWEKAPLNSATGLAEFKSAPFTSLTVTTPISLGTNAGRGFDKFGVANDVANFGTDGEDLEFIYNTPEGPVRGHIQYIGTKFENNLVLRVNPNSGEAFLKNDSEETLSFDGYSIRSTTGSLDSLNWDGLAGDWAKTDIEPSALSETNLFGSITLAPGQQAPIGDIGAFATAAAQDGLSMEFILSEALGGGSGPATGDHNLDGTVDAADYVMWRKTNSGNQAAYDDWRENFGVTGGGSIPEGTLRVGSIVFDTGAGAGGSAPVPEPGTLWMMLVGIVGALASRRSRHSSRQLAFVEAAGNNTNGQMHVGGGEMSSRFGFYIVAALAVNAALVAAPPAVAAPEGIPLINYDFEDPGPLGVKTFAFNVDGTPNNAIPGWTFAGPGAEDNDPERLGDSGTEGSGGLVVDNEMLLSVNDGKTYQIASGFALRTITDDEIYKFAFDARDIFTIDANGTGLDDSGQLTARFFYGAWAVGQRTLLNQVINLSGDMTRYEFTIPFNSPLLTAPALGQSIGVEFTTTSKDRNLLVDKSWSHIDNVVMQIAPVLEGDLDGNGTLTAADYNILRGNIARSACDVGIRGCPFEADGEMTGDYVVNLNDFREFKNAFSAGAGGGSSVGDGNVPEPTTPVLVLLAVGMIAAAKRRRAGSEAAICNRMRALWFTVIGSSALLATVPAEAELYVYDPFRLPNPLTNPANPAQGQYNEWTPPGPGATEPHGPHVPLAGQNAIPFYGTRPSYFEGPWRTSGNAPGGAVHPSSISYATTPNEGGSARVAPVPNPSYVGPATEVCGTSSGSLYSSCDGRTARFFATPFTAATNETVYISFLANFGETEGDLGFRGIEFFPDTAVPTGDWSEARFLDLGYNGFYGYNNPLQQNPNTAKLGLGLYGQGQQRILTDAPSSYNNDGRTHLFVMRFEFSSTNNMDNIYVYMDPASTSQPELANAEFLAMNFTLSGFSTVTRYGGTAPTLATMTDLLMSGGVFDELRIGSTFADVLPPGMPVPGDADGDLDVDLNDYVIIRDNFHRDDASGPIDGDVGKSDGRLGFDGLVDSGDFFLWKREYEKTLLGSGGGDANTGVPEPSTMLLAAIVATLAFGIPGRRRLACAAG